MKNFLMIIGLLFVSANVFVHAQEQQQYTYTPAYVQHLKNCSVYKDEYVTNIPTGDSISPYLKIKSTEEVLGFINGKCYTKSTIYSYDLDQTIMTIKCGLTKDQVAAATRKMNQVNAEASLEARRELQKDLTSLIEDRNSCRVKNYLDDNN